MLISEKTAPRKVEAPPNPDTQETLLIEQRIMQPNRDAQEALWGIMERVKKDTLIRAGALGRAQAGD